MTDKKYFRVYKVFFLSASLLSHVQLGYPDSFNIKCPLEFASNDIRSTLEQGSLESRGKALRADIESASVDIDSLERSRHFTAICSRFILPEMSFADLIILLRAAGMKSPVIHLDPSAVAAKGNPLTYFAAITLYSNLVNSAQLLIIFTTKNSNKIKQSVDTVRCSITRKAL